MTFNSDEEASTYSDAEANTYATILMNHGWQLCTGYKCDTYVPTDTEFIGTYQYGKKVQSSHANHWRGRISSFAKLLHSLETNISLSTELRENYANCVCTIFVSDWSPPSSAWAS